jgi:hypothetical protein
MVRIFCHDLRFRIWAGRLFFREIGDGFGGQLHLLTKINLTRSTSRVVQCCFAEAMQFASDVEEKTLSDNFDAPKLCEAIQNDNEYWQEINMDPESYGNGFACSVPITDKRARHKLVERNRRDKTRVLVQQLQSILPNIKEHSQNPKTNDILEKTLQYLHAPENKSSRDSSLQDDIGNDGGRTKSLNRALASSKLRLAAPFPLDNLSSRRHIFSFENAPFGMVIARTDGLLLKANVFFHALFHLPLGSLIGQTMFSLTSAQDLAITMKVRQEAPLHRPPTPLRSSNPSLCDGVRVTDGCQRMVAAPCATTPLTPALVGGGIASIESIVDGPQSCSRAQLRPSSY